MGYIVNHFINNQIVAGASEKSGEIFNPATGSLVGKVVFANSSEVDQAVLAAKTAFPGWSNISPIRRARVFFDYLRLLQENLSELAAIVTREHGKTLDDAKGSVQRGIEIVEYICGAPDLLKGWFSENIATDVDSYTIRQPLGVCAGITPFNFPAMIPLWMFPTSIVCGNTFVLKPSEKDPSCALLLAELFAKAGGPPGVLNVIQGSKDVVDNLLHHQDIAAISFVGSTPVAKHIYNEGTAHGKRVQAFGGAKNHCIVMPDADIEQTAEAIVGAAYGSAGERCMAISVVVVVGDDVADKLVAAIQPKVSQLKIGAGDQADIMMGPLITRSHYEKVKSYIDIGLNEGAKLIVDGRNCKIVGYEKGYFLGGSLFDYVTPNMKIYQDEIFGPVLIVVRTQSFEEALEIINNNPYGNGTAIFTRDGYTARQFTSQVKVGMVGVNVPIPVPAPYHAFGGWKQSMFGDVNMHSESIRFYTRLKTITQRWLAEKQQIKAGFTIPTH